MKIYSTVTPSYKAASKVWLVRSVQKVEPGAELEIEHFDEISGSSDFQSQAFREHNLEKNKRLTEWIRSNEGELIFVSDSDIIYVRPFLQRLKEELGTADIALAVEGPLAGYNIGQMVIRCSEPVAAFFEEVAIELAKGAWDQKAVNRLLWSSELVHRSLSPLFCDTTIWELLPATARHKIYSYHATVTQPQKGKSSMERKQERMREVLTQLELKNSPEKELGPV